MSPAPLPLTRTELSDHLDAMDSNLDNLQTMLTTHGFSVDTSTLLDVSPSPARPTPSLPCSQGSLTAPPFPAAVQPLGDGSRHEPAGPGQQPGQRA